MPPPDFAKGETSAGSWLVYLGEQTPQGAKVTGRLYATSLHVRFQGSLALAAGAGAVSQGIQAFQPTATSFAIPYSRIAAAYISRKWLILKTLNLRLDDGFVIPVHFGAMSPAAALAIIRRKLQQRGKDLRADGENA